ncbi:MAG: phosphoribosyl-AMP cyclohydrolase [Leucothrix sp.]
MNDSAIKQLIQQLQFNPDGLIPAIAQQHDTGEVLMMAWMNETSMTETLKTNRVCYWSRSRQSLWRKGESSGQVQMLTGFRVDCDADTLLLEVDQTGPACHTGRRSCFYRIVKGNELITDAEPLIDPATLYGQ